MKKKQSKDYQDLIKESGISLDELTSNPKTITKSTRTTFNLKKNIYETMSFLCTNYGMKQKEFIDDVVVPNASSVFADPELREVLSKGQDSNQSGDYERRTFVLSKTSLKKFNELSKNTGIHRDTLFTIGVSLQKLVLDNRNAKHQQAFEILDQLLKHIGEIEKKITEFLPVDDPIPRRVGIVGMILDNLLMAIEAELNRGVPIVGDDLSQQG